MSADETPPPRKRQRVESPSLRIRESSTQAPSSAAGNSRDEVSDACSAAELAASLFGTARMPDCSSAPLIDNMVNDLNTVGSSSEDHSATTAATEDTNTDDEDLQHLTMVIHAGARFDGSAGITDGAVGELNYEDVRTILFQAARDQKISTLQKCFRIIKLSTNHETLMKQLVEAEDETGLTLLMIAVRNNMVSLCSFLLHEGADINHSSEKRSYALLLSAQKGLVEMTQFLLDHGANPESKSMAMIPAAHFGHLPVVKLLLAHDADQNYANKKGTTPLMRAAQEGRGSVVEFLLKSGADPCASNNEGMTALMLAAQRGHATIASMLIRAGSDVNKQTRQGSTALLLAAKRGHTTAVEALLTAGADIFLKDDRDKTPADIAKRRGHAELCFKITVSNQLRLMREDLRRQRCHTFMRFSSLYIAGRAVFAVSKETSPQRLRYHQLLDRTMNLPRPLQQNIALYLPLCGMWEHQLKYLVYQVQVNPNQVVQQGVQIIDEILRSIFLEMRTSFQELSVCARRVPRGQLAMLRDCEEYRNVFISELPSPMAESMLHQLRRMADIQGALSVYLPGPGINFGEQVAHDVVVILDEMLRWNELRRRSEMPSRPMVNPSSI